MYEIRVPSSTVEHFGAIYWSEVGLLYLSVSVTLSGGLWKQGVLEVNLPGPNRTIMLHFLLC